MGIGVSVADFDSEKYPHERADLTNGDPGENQRMHLLFAYINGRGFVNSGEQVVLARSFRHAAALIARERGIDRVLILKRFMSGKPASAAIPINKVYRVA